MTSQRVSTACSSTPGVTLIGLDPALYGILSLRRTKVALIYKRTSNLCACANSFSAIQSCKALCATSESRLMLRFSFRSNPTYDTWRCGHPPCHFHHSPTASKGGLLTHTPQQEWDTILMISTVPANTIHSGSPALPSPSINSFAFGHPPRAIIAEIVKAGSS